MSDIKSFEGGQTIGGYEVTRKEPLENLQGWYYELIHTKTGAKHLHLAVPDDNNGYNVVFPTVPKDSTGVPHILEHVSLMGSKKYPVKDPFFSMIPRSLQTFLNATTFPDLTNFLFSTRNEKDYYNLLSIYLDAPFFPLLREESFKQDGHRLEFTKGDDPTSGLCFKGVVFNEMKARINSPLDRGLHAIGSALYPDLTYANESGGDPQFIPDLTYDDLQEFHRTHYHPSNSYFLTYGNLPLDKTLHQIENEALQHFDKITPDVDIPDQKRFDQPREFRTQFALGRDEDPDRKTTVLIGWLTTHTSNSYEMLVLKVLQEVLLGNAASPLRKALIDSGLGEALADFAGIQTDYREASFVVGLKGTNPDLTEKIEQLVLETLEGVVKDGIDNARVEAAIHQLEIQSREISNAQYPYAIKMLYSLQGPFLYGGDPYKQLQFDQDIAKLQDQRKAGPYFEEVIRKYFLDNTHRVRMIIEPDRELEARQEEAERQRLAKIEAALTDADKAALVEAAKRLEELQDTKPNVEVLPTLELSDVPMKFEDIAHSIEEISGARVGFFPQPTNGITYIDIQADFSGLPERLKDLLGLFAYAFPKSGAGDSDYLEMADRIDSFTGGIGAGAGTRAIAATEDSFRQVVTLSGKALARNHEPFVAILKDLLTSVRFDAKRLKDLIAEYKGQYDSFLVFVGHEFARELASAKLSKQKQLDERIGGLSLYTVLKNLATKSEDELASVIQDLDEIADHIFRTGAINVCVTTQEKNIGEIRSLLTDALSGLPTETSPSKDDGPAFVVEFKHEARAIPAPVNFNALVVKTPEVTHPDAPALLVLSQWLGSKYYIRELREKGGAYGAAAGYTREGGFFSFITARDPNIARTYEVFMAGVAEVIDKGIAEVDLKESILSACRQVDPLSSPDTKGRTRFFGDLAGYSLELQERFKKGLLEVTEEDVRRVAKTYLTAEAGVMATLGNPDKIAEANEAMRGVFEVASV